MAVDLSECRAKIKRAHEHRNALYDIIWPVVSGTALKSDLVQVNAKLDPQSGQHIFRVATILEDWRLSVSIVLGDVVHNLRSALDYLYWQLLYCHYIRVPQTEGEAKRVEFPIEDSSRRFANKRDHVRKIPWAQWAVMDIAQPYNGTDPPRRALRALRELSNRDKHRALNPLLLRTTNIQLYDRTMAAQATTEFKFPDSRQRALGDRHLKVGTEVMRVGLPIGVDTEMKMASHIIPAVQLPEMDLPMVFGASLMIRAVNRIVEGISPLL